MKPLVVMDTNVARVANRCADQAGPDCVIRCIERMQKIRKEERVALDRGGYIFEEYLDRRNWSAEPGPGHEFFRWLWDHQSYSDLCVMFEIEPHDARTFAEFPEDEALAAFDRDDRKFVAVAVASGENPPILNASDTDWWNHRHDLERHGIRLEFLCPELMEAGRKRR